MSWWIAGSAAVSVGAQILGRNSTQDSIENQQAWADYNANVQYGIDVNNIKAQTAITEMNAAMLLKGTEASNELNSALVEYNAEVIKQTALYNDLLYEEDLANMWTQANLDIQLIGLQRQRERGTIEAGQSASGTVMGTGSNADVIVDQMTQEALDLFIVKTGADMQANKIANARVQSLYMADQEINQMRFEGRVQNQTTSLNASLEAMSMLYQNEISTIAGMSEAEIRRTTGISNNAARAGQQSDQADRNFLAGMFGIASDTISQVGASMTINPSNGPSVSTETAVPGAAPVSISSGGAGGAPAPVTILAGNYKNTLVT